MSNPNKESAPLVSVIIPARNADEFIGECLRSVLQQSHDKLEIIVLDDGSEDDTPAVVKAFDDERIQLLGTSGIGAAAARNRGLEIASGEYLQFLDADDGLSPDKIRNQLEYLNSFENAIVSCAWGHFEEDFDQTIVRPQPVWGELDPVRWLQQSISGAGMMQTACWLIPRHIAEATGLWDESLSLHDDGEYFARVLMNCERQIFVEDATVYYRTVQGSLSRTRTRKAVESALKVCEARDKLLLLRDDSRNSRVAIATSYAQFAYEFSRDHQDLATQAVRRIKVIGTDPLNVIGGRLFRAAVTVVGFPAALEFRRLARL